MVGFNLIMLVVGFVIGAIARLVLPGPDPMGCLGTAVLGVAGSLVGGLVADLLFGHQARNPSLYPVGLIGSLEGVMILC